MTPLPRFAARTAVTTAALALLAPAVAGAVFGAFGIVPAFFIDVVTALLGVGVLLLVTVPTNRPLMFLFGRRFATGGDPEPKMWIRLFFAIATAFMAAALLMAGGLSAIQTLAITIGLPFSVLMLVMCVSTLRTLSYSVARVEAVRRRAQLASIKTHLGLDTDDEVVDGPATASQWWASLSRDHQQRIADAAADAAAGAEAGPAARRTRLRRTPR